MLVGRKLQDRSFEIQRAVLLIGQWDEGLDFSFPLSSDCFSRLAHRFFVG